MVNAKSSTISRATSAAYTTTDSDNGKYLRGQVGLHQVSRSHRFLASSRHRPNFSARPLTAGRRR